MELNTWSRYKKVILNVEENDLLHFSLNYIYLSKKRRLNFYFESQKKGSFTGDAVVLVFCEQFLGPLLDISFENLFWFSLSVVHSGPDVYNIKKRQNFLLKNLFFGKVSSDESRVSSQKKEINFILQFFTGFETNFIYKGISPFKKIEKKEILEPFVAVLENTKPLFIQEIPFFFKGISPKLDLVIACDFY